LILGRVFFDSSALVKPYHPEVGTSAFDQIVNSSANPIKGFFDETQYWPWRNGE
jgi:hypothetical protein